MKTIKISLNNSKTTSDYEELRRLIENDKKNFIRYKPDFLGPGAPVDKKGWMKTPYLWIREDDGKIYEKTKGLFTLRNYSLPYSNKSKMLPWIFVYTYSTKESSNRTNNERRFITLTHEYGHFISWKNDMRPIGYDEAQALFRTKILWKRMTQDDKNIIWEEEVRAWNEGVKFVQSKGFELPDVFYKEKRRALNTYRKVLLLK